MFCFRCHCNSGYEKKHASGKCEDKNECALYGDSLCNTNAECINTEGSFRYSKIKKKSYKMWKNYLVFEYVSNCIQDLVIPH